MPTTQLLIAMLLTLGSFAATAAQAQNQTPPASKQRVYVGTYTRNGSEGIYLCELDPKSGALALVGLAAEANNPSFLALHPKGEFLYAVSEIDDYAATGGGAVAAYAVNRGDGKLTPLNHQSSGGRGPCHISLDSNAKNALVANYGSGSASVIPLADDGTLRKPTATVQHEGSSVNPDRQTAPHAHSINVSPDNRFAFVADLGLDKVLVYKLEAATGTLTPNDPPSVQLAPGAGPRHFAFHPSGEFAYVINELTSTVTALAYDAEHGVLKELQTLTTLPADFTGNNTTAEVQVHPTGKFLYGSNRGHDSIAMFAIDPATGKLTALGQHPSGGKTPRNFGIDPTGAFLLAAHQDSNSVVVHRIDSATGRLSATDHQVEIPTPVCIKFAP
jgi:6-phosphogluconolactonase